MSVALSNTAIAQRIDIEHFAGDSFERYLVLETLEGEPFDTSGYSFSMLIYQESAPIHRFINVPITLTAEANFLSFIKASNVIVQEGSFSYELKATKNLKTFTPLCGDFHVTRKPASESYSEDSAEIDSPLLQLKMRMLLAVPAGLVVSPEPGNAALPYSLPFTLLN